MGNSISEMKEIIHGEEISEYSELANIEGTK